MTDIVDAGIRESEAEAVDALAAVYSQCHEAWLAVLAQRESILKAFIAEYGLMPHEVEQVEVRDWNRGESRWYVRRREGA